MAPSEIEILENYLLQPAHLTSITTLDQFKLLFPARYHDSLQLRSLFRDLQAIRGGVIEEVEAAIAIESKEGKIMRREMVRERRAAEMEEADGEIEMERAVSCPPCDPPYHDQQRLTCSCVVIWKPIWHQSCEAQHQLHRPRAERRSGCS